MKVKIVEPKAVGMLYTHKDKVYSAIRLDDGGVKLTDKGVEWVRVARHNVGEGRPVVEQLEQQFDWPFIMPIPYTPGVP